MLVSWTVRQSNYRHSPRVTELVRRCLWGGDTLRCPGELGDLPQVQESRGKLGEVSAAASFGDHPLEGNRVVTFDIGRGKVNSAVWGRLVFEPGDQRDGGVRLVSCAVDTAFGEPDHWRRGPRVAAAVLSRGFVGFARRAALKGERSGDPDGVTRAAERSRPRCEEPHGRRSRCDDCAHRECECAVLTFQGRCTRIGKK